MPNPLFVVGQPDGLVSPGNIDLMARPKVRNKDGSISTVRSISFTGPNGAEYLIPTVNDSGKIMSNEEAIKEFYRTGRHLGVFASPSLATAYAKFMHEQQAQQYLPKAGVLSWSEATK